MHLQFRDLTFVRYERQRTMALRIRDPRVEKLVTALVELTGETETDVVKKALNERLTKLQVDILPDLKDEDSYRAQAWHRAII